MQSILSQLLDSLNHADYRVGSDCIFRILHIESHNTHIVLQGIRIAYQLSILGFAVECTGSVHEVQLAKQRFVNVFLEKKSLSVENVLKPLTPSILEKIKFAFDVVETETRSKSFATKAAVLLKLWTDEKDQILHDVVEWIELIREEKKEFMTQAQQFVLSQSHDSVLETISIAQLDNLCKCLPHESLLIFDKLKEIAIFQK